MGDPRPTKFILRLPEKTSTKGGNPFRGPALWVSAFAVLLLWAWAMGFRSGAHQREGRPAEPSPAAAENPPLAPVASAPADEPGPPPAAPALAPALPRHADAGTESAPGAAPQSTPAADPVRGVEPAPVAPAAQTPAAPATGAVEFTSEPDRAEVWWAVPDAPARRLGTTPLKLDRFPAGPQEFEFRLPNSPAQKAGCEVKPGAVASVRGVWNDYPVAITSSPPGASVVVDGNAATGQRPPVTPVTLSLREGRHDLVASYPGLEPVTLPIVVGRNAPAEPVHLRFRFATVRFSTEPVGAAVYLAGKLAGLTPLELPAIAPGIHHVLLRREGHARTSLDLVLRNGETRESHTALAVNPEPEPGFPFTNAHGLRMVWIPKLDGWAQATEMTQAAYQAVMNENPSHFTEPSRPVEGVSWSEAFRFCDKLTTAEQGRGFLPAGFRYSLPTDEQWSLLAEGSSPAQGVHSLASPRDGTAPAGSLRPSPLGVCDAVGNVWEWCLDWYSPAVLDRALREGSPAEYDKAGATHKVLRGGSWNRSVANQVRVSARRAASPTQHRDYETGFRVVLLPRSG